MNDKQNDLMLNLVANPTFTLADFQAVGLNATNTTVKSASYYKNNPYIQQQFTKPDGRFDDKAFNEKYQSAQLGLATLNLDNANQAAQRQVQAAVSDISAPTEKRRSLRDMYKVHTVANPTKQSYGMIGWKQESKRTLSTDELAQKSKVLLNPLTAGDNLENAQWGDDPHNGFFNYWNKTLVMAAWESDGTHTDLLTSQTVSHKKGDLKTNENGDFYYETLQGRSPYGRKILNKMNVLTEDGSTFNKFDFFDSDGMDKSAGGTIMKNLALVGSMFIPYVGPAITAISLIPQLAGIAGTLGKMAVGSDNALFSELEGFRRSWEAQGNVSEAAQQNPWALENWINLVGDTVAQLRQQRFIFEKVPTLFKGKYAGSTDAVKKVEEGFLKQNTALYDTELANLGKAIKDNPNKYMLKWSEFAHSKDTIIGTKTAVQIQEFMDSYNKIGSVISKGYMTGITVMDTYGEAKEAGATDLEATLITLGHGAAEAWILNTEIGQWILPEINNHRAQNRAVVKTLMNAVKGKQEKTISEAGKAVVEAVKGDKTNKRAWAQKIINTTKDFFKGEYFANGSKAKGLIGTTIAGALGEGTEEVSEEIIADLSKALFNTAKWLSGDDKVRMNSFGFMWDGNQFNWNSDDFFARYGMSFFGGLLGGGINNLGTSYRINTNLGNMSLRDAYKSLVQEARNNGLDSIRKELNKYEIGASNDIAAVPKVDADGNVDYTADGTNSQNYQARKVINQVLDFVEDTLNASKTNLTDVEFLDRQMLGEWRYQLLANSQTAVDFLEEFNKLNVDLLTAKGTLQTKENELLDLNKDGIATDPEKRAAQQKKDTELNDNITGLKEEIKSIEDKLQAYINGDYSQQFMSRAFLEMSDYLNSDLGVVPFPIFVQKRFGKKYDDLSDHLKKRADEEWEAYKKNPENRDRIKYGAEMLLELQKLLAPELPGMVLDVDTEEYKKATFAFNRLLHSAYANADEETFRQIANDPIEYRMVRVLAAINPDLAKQIYDQSTFLTPENYRNLLNATDAEYNAYKQRYEQKQQQDEQDRNTATASTNNSIQILEEALKKEIDKINKDYQDQIDNTQKEIQKIKDKIDSLNQEKADLIQKNPTQTGIEKAKTTRRIRHGIPKEISDLETEKAKLETKLAKSEVDNLNEIERTRNQAINTKKLEHEKKLEPLLEQRNKEIGVVNKAIAKDLEQQRESFKTAINMQAVDDVKTALQAIIQKGYLKPGQKQEIVHVLSRLTSDLGDLANQGLVDPMEAYELSVLQQTITGKVVNGQLQGGLAESKLQSILNRFALATGQGIFNYTELIDRIYQQLSVAQDVSDVKAMQDVEDAMSNAYMVIRMLKLAIKGSTVDTLSVANHNPFGFTAMLNAISEKQGNPLNLATLSSDQTLPIISQLEEMENQLVYVKRIYELNKGNKFNQQDNASRKLVKSVYTALEKFFSGDTNPLKQWDNADYANLQATINSVVGDDVMKQSIQDVEANKAKLEKAFFEFGQKHIDKLKDVDKMAEFMSMFDLFDNSTQTMNEEMDHITDLQLAHYIMSCFTMNANDFYHKVAGLDFGDVAPIPLQLEAARMAYAKIMNEDLFRVYFKGIEKSIKDKVSKMSPDEFKQAVLKNSGEEPAPDMLKEVNKTMWHTAIAYPKYSTLTLIEGIAGSGKTSGVFDILNKLLNQELSSNIYFVHAAKETSAEVAEIGNGLFGAGRVKGFNRIDFLNHFITDFKDLVYDKDKDQYDIVPGTTTFDTENGIQSTQNLNKTAEVPKVIFIDEISLFSETDIQLINKWALENGITVIAAGDYHQTNVRAKQNIVLPSNDTLGYFLNPVPALFYSPPKLGISMRTGNSVKTSNQQKFESFLSITKNYSEGVTLEYTREGDQLFGDIGTRKLEDALKEIRRIKSTLNAGEKITYIYDSKSTLYDELVKPEFEPYILFKPGNQAQGDETRYSIVDLSKRYTPEGLKTAAEYLYTGITRAKQGSIIFTPEQNLVGNTPGTIVVTSRFIDAMYSEQGYEQFLKNYSQKRLEILRAVYTQGNEIPFTPITKVDTSSNGNTNTQSQNNSPQQNSQQQNNNQQQNKRRRRSRKQPNNPPQNNPPTQPQNNPPTQNNNNNQQNNNQPQNNPPQTNPPTASRKFNDGQKVVNRQGTIGTIVGYDDTLNMYWVKEANGSLITESEDRLQEYQMPKPVDTLQQELARQNYQITTEQLSKPMGSNADNNARYFKQEFLDEGYSNMPKNYYYYGVDSVADLLRLLIDKDDSGITLSDDYNQKHLFYVVADNIKEAPTIDNISTVVTSLDDQFTNIVIDFINQFRGTSQPIVTNSIKQHVAAISNADQEVQNTLNTDLYTERLQEEELDPDQIDTKNESSVTNSYAPGFTKRDYIDSMDFSLGFFSLNALELGAIEDPNNKGRYMFDQQGAYVDQRTGKTVTRIDSVNGLYKIYQEYKKGNPLFANLDPSVIDLFEGANQYQVDPALDILAELQNVCTLGQNKSEMLDNINAILGIENLFINFAIRVIPPRTQVENDPGSDSTVNTQYHKDTREKVYGLDNDVVNQDKVCSVQLVALVGKQKYGEFIELPLFSISNPITIIKSQSKNDAGVLVDNFPREKAILLQAPSEIEGLKLIAQQDTDIGKYCQLYTRGNHFLFKIGIVALNSNLEYANTSSNLDIANWVPADLLSGRVSFSQMRGKYQADTGQLVYEAPKVPNKYIKLPRFLQMDRRFAHTEIMQSNSGLIQANGQTARVNKGHNFILSSQSATYQTTDDIIKQYVKEQNDPNLPKTVHITYVIAPEASIREYYDYLNTVIVKGGRSQLSYDIGYHNTTHKLFSLILKDPSLVHLFDNLGVRVSGIADNKAALISQIKELDTAYEKYIQTKSQEDKKKYLELLSKKVKGAGITVSEFLNKSFLRVFSDANNEVNEALIKELQTAFDNVNQQLIAQGKTPWLLTYNPRLDPNAQEKYGLKTLLGVKDGTLKVNTTFKEFRIRGKLDTIQYSGKIPLFQQLMANFVRGNNRRQSDIEIASQYCDFDADYIRWQQQQSQPNKNRSNRQSSFNMQELFNQVLRGTGITYTVRQTSNPLQAFVMDINNMNTPYVAYIYNGRPYIRNLSKYKNNKTVELRDLNNQPITELVNGQVYQLIFKDSQLNVETSKATFDNGVFTFIEPEPAATEASTTPKIEQQTIIDAWKARYPQNVKIFGKGVPNTLLTYNSGIERLIKNKSMSQKRVEKLKGYRQQNDSPEMQNTIDFLLDIENMIQQLKEEDIRGCGLTLE